MPQHLRFARRIIKHFSRVTRQQFVFEVVDEKDRSWADLFDDFRRHDLVEVASEAELFNAIRASLHLALVESVVLAEQDDREFLHLVNLAAAVDIEEIPSLRLVNVLAQRRVRWLRQRMPDLFLYYDSKLTTR